MDAGLLGNSIWNEKKEVIIFTVQDSYDGLSCLFDQDVTASPSKWAKQSIKVVYACESLPKSCDCDSN